MTKWISLFAMTAATLWLGACASSPEETRSPAVYAEEYEPPEGSRQHPSSYFMEGFNIPKKRVARPPANQPFFFKHCSDGPGRSPHSATSYDCDHSL